MDAADNLWTLLFICGIAVLFYARSRLRNTTRIFITDYQRGVRYSQGIFADILEPGCYDSYVPKEQITVVNMRPQPFVIERLLYQDALQAPSVISVGAELNVSDPYCSVTALKDPVNEAIAIVREALRATVSRGVIDGGPESRSKAVGEIKAAANVDLNRCGLQVSNLEITEVWSRPTRPQITARAN